MFGVVFRGKKNQFSQNFNGNKNVLEARPNEPPAYENPPLPGPLLPLREEREKSTRYVGTQGVARGLALPWANILLPLRGAQALWRRAVATPHCDDRDTVITAGWPRVPRVPTVRPFGVR